MKLTIIHTNDIHSNFTNFARISSFIKKEKNGSTIVLDAGDFADFKSIELQGTNGLAAVELLESTGYDAIAVGNNEVFKSIDTLEYMAGHSRIPFLSCNILTKHQSEIKGIKKSVILDKNGVRFLVIGTSPSIGPFDELLGFSIKDYKDAIQKEMQSNEGKYDICLLLNHIGTDNDEILAKEVEGIDVIISSHDHKLFDNAKVVGSTIINSAGAYGEYLGVIDIDYSQGDVNLINARVIPTSGLEPDIETMKLLATNKDKAIRHLSKPLYQIEMPLWHDVIEENPISNLIADGLRNRLNCDIGIINSGIVNGGLIDSSVTEKKLIEICPSPLNPTRYEIKGQDLKEAIQSSLDADVCLLDGKGPGFRGSHLGRLHISGATIQYNGNHVSDIIINGEKLVDEKWYTVASSDYLQRGTGYPTLAKNRNVKYQVEYIRDLLRDYANQEEYVDQAFNKRWIEIK